MAIKHPLIQKHIDRLDVFLREAADIAEKLEKTAYAESRLCGIIESGAGCACTGACHTRQYYVMLMAAYRLRHLDE